MTNARAYVLDEDPELAELVPEARLGAARQASLAAVLEVGTGMWDAREDADRARDGFGLLVLDGALIRRVGYGGRFGAELLADGDLLRPWEFDGDALARLRDRLAGAHADAPGGARPAVDRAHGPLPARGAGAGRPRACSATRRLAAMMAISQQPRLDDRLWMLFWELADRHGKVHPDGVHVDLPLTHEVLSHLAGARRPSVSSALTKLAEQGRLRAQRPRLGAARRSAGVATGRTRALRRRDRGSRGSIGHFVGLRSTK